MSRQVKLYNVLKVSYGSLILVVTDKTFSVLQRTAVFITRLTDNYSIIILKTFYWNQGWGNISLV